MYPHQTSILTYRSKFLPQAKRLITQKQRKLWKRTGTWTDFPYCFVWGKFPDWDITLLLCKGRIEKIPTELLKWDQTPPGILLGQYNIKWVSWKKCFPTSDPADTRKLHINAFKRASAGISNFLSLYGGVETWAIQCGRKLNVSAWLPVAGMQCNPGNSRCANNSPC